MTRPPLRGWAIAASLLVAGCAATSRDSVREGAAESAAVPSVPGIAVALRNPGFEDEPNPGRACPIGWDCTMHADPHSFRFFQDETSPHLGKRSLCFEPMKKEPWGVASQGVFDLHQMRGARVRFSVAVRLEAVTGGGAGPYAVAQGGGGAVIAHAQRLLQGTLGWQRVEVDLAVPQNASLVEVGVSLEGRGRVCLDDARLEIVRQSKSPV